jgi:ABC-type transport system involved in multi-copper enzyme maturation permease subunit
LLTQSRRIARQELLWLRRGWTVPVVAVLFGLVVASIVRAASPPGPGEQPLTLLALVADGAPVSPTAVVVFTLARLLTLLLPLVTVVLTAGTLAGDAESGRLRTLQTLPVSRRAVVFGKLSTRSAAVVGVVAFGLLVGALTTWLRFGTVDPVAYGLFLLVSVAFTLSLTATTVAVSTLVATRSRAVAFSLGPLLLFAFVGVDPGVPAVLRTGLLVQPYQFLVAGTHDQLVAIPRVVLTSRAPTSSGEFSVLGLLFSDGLSICALFAWPVGLLALAVFRFDRRDL